MGLVDRWLLSIETWMRKRTKGAASYWATPYLFGLVCVIAITAQAWRLRFNIVTEHNVVVYSQDSNGDWNYSSDEKPNGDTFRSCPEDKSLAKIDVNGILKQASEPPPYIADYASWEERGTCRSIARSDLGFFFKDKHNNFTYRRLGELSYERR